MSDTTQATLEALLAGQSIGEAAAGELMRALTDETLPPARAGALLATLRAKGETADELRGFARVMRELAVKPAIPDDFYCVDIVGTGGDGSGSYNLSTGAALVCAAAGLPVAKHGNRSVSSKSGSADVLTALGFPVPLDADRSAAALKAHGFTFFFAPQFHPAMKAIAPIRNALKVRTIFNVLGPLANPTEPPFNVIGAYSEDAARMMADTLAGLPATRSFVIHGEPGWDEATPVGEFLLLDVTSGKVSESRRTPEDYGVKRCTVEALAGGDAEHNAKALLAVIEGEDRGAHRDALLMGAALALEVTGEVETPLAGMERAAAAIDTGKARELVTALAAFS